ncbi:hypothetical protein CO051_04485 [Candidatus Roizmanbacteria bacterium CG_4_9_14_0_2_um_filter_39_13]|uniref:Uncharacterized protein n=2 Tax=Candidatus Roizmaniibacteriota TaxID=1752723 RepID=A0A2M8EXZ9_9BACT|nr:MAG: hypothetical protein COY15_01850 [Candidatus Roizmanbacteria bacterium CG_4_10_14_0_2_um_filter_39_12]PJC31055.1 MAG: hypothetical protein CO051_04485 [Candidatus Roizmanbacteria bacterium CG_4_9_14_0_2_um_filter_39_13]PJE61885.1 MAG: hypothetical protein COU87_02265 [Candidatus Roizmanbacteria bacterium CG10_big_fil_rev_8_21_14_0_10_39_12]
MWTVFDLLKRFVSDLWKAVIFATIEFDENLQMTQNTSQRLLIWGIIGVIILLLSYGLLYVIWYFLDAIKVSPL